VLQCSGSTSLIRAFRNCSWLIGAADGPLGGMTIGGGALTVAGSWPSGVFGAGAGAGAGAAAGGAGRAPGSGRRLEGGGGVTTGICAVSVNLALQVRGPVI